MPAIPDLQTKKPPNVTFETHPNNTDADRHRGLIALKTATRGKRRLQAVAISLKSRRLIETRA
jgi:hypothetical protein